MDTAKKTARALRKDQTEAEEMLWEKLRNRRFNGIKFLRQHPIVFSYNGQERFFIADFYCAQRRLVIEIDGPVHENQREYDELRSEILESLGYTVIRFNNDEVLNSIESVLGRI
jgi:very-short-patch-repair endonuclease